MRHDIDPDIECQLCARIDELEREKEVLAKQLDQEEQLSERLRQEASIHAQEARTQRATVQDIYQLVSGGKGEPGNWRGAEPVRDLIAERDALAAHVERLTHLWVAIDDCEAESDEQVVAISEMSSAVQDAPTTSLARRQAEGGMVVSERKEGWYWVKQETSSAWETARLNQEHFDNIEDFWAVVGQRIPTPDEPWQCVPVEPTEKMTLALSVSSGTDAPVKDPIGFWSRAHKRMLAAAPKP